MKARCLTIIMAFITAAFLGGCASQPSVVTMQEPSGQQEKVSMPKGAWTGAASGAQADALAQTVVDANNNTMQQFDRVEGRMDKLQTTENKDLQTAEEALQKLEAAFERAGYGSDHHLLQDRVDRDRPVSVPAVGELPGLPRPREPWTDGHPPVNRKCVRHREPPVQQETEQGAFRGAPSRHQSVPGEHPSQVL